MQTLIVESDHDIFNYRVQRLLDVGYVVVPNTLSVSTSCYQSLFYERYVVVLESPPVLPKSKTV